MKYAIALVESLKQYFEKERIVECYLSMPPTIYQREYSSYVDFAFNAADFSLKYREIFNVVDLRHADNDQLWNNYEGRARTSIRKSADLFDIYEDESDYPGEVC